MVNGSGTDMRGGWVNFDTLDYLQQLSDRDLVIRVQWTPQNDQRFVSGIQITSDNSDNGKLVEHVSERCIRGDSTWLAKPKGWTINGQTDTSHTCFIKLKTSLANDFQLAPFASNTEDRYNLVNSGFRAWSVAKPRRCVSWAMNALEWLRDTLAYPFERT